MNSSGSNYGPTSQALHDRIKQQVDAMRKAAPGKAIPGDLVTASGSGLDPDLSPEAAFYQVDRIAALRHLDPPRCMVWWSRASTTAARLSGRAACECV
jgi:K+-transporting ATPase ATPase C chain